MLLECLLLYSHSETACLQKPLLVFLQVHLVSEHIWCDDYLVRSFYLKNLQTNETRTVTQFHFLTWLDLGIPGSIKALLDFRRSVSRCYIYIVVEYVCEICQLI